MLLEPISLDDVCDAEALMARVQASVAQVELLVDRIPARHYQPREFDGHDIADRKFFKGASAHDRKVGQHKVERGGGLGQENDARRRRRDGDDSSDSGDGDGFSDRGRTKTTEEHHAAMRQRLDPANAKTTREVQLERRLADLEAQQKAAQTRDLSKEAPSREDTSMATADAELKEKRERRTGPERLGMLVLSTRTDQAAREELKRNLRNAINDMRAKRKAAPLGADGQPAAAGAGAGTGGDADAEKRAEEQAARAASRREKRVAKRKLRASRKRKAADSQHQEGGEGGAVAEQQNGAADGTEDGPAAKRARVAVPTSAPHDVSATKISSKVDFGETLAAKKADKVHDLMDGARPKKAKKSTKELLEEAEQQKLLLQQLRGTQEGAELAKNLKWNAALQRAEGKVVKDDPNLLRKTLKREQSLKAKKAKKWDERKEAVEEKQRARVAQREANITARAEEKKLRKANKRAGIKTKSKSKSHKGRSEKKKGR